jgi:hypothetical protein
VDQVSKPVLIALVAAIALIGVKFTILRSNGGGGGSTPASATAPGQAGLQSAIDKANNAVGVSKQSAARSEQAAAAASGDASPTTSTPGSAPSATKAAKPAATAKPAAKPAKPLPKLAPGDKSGPILQNLADGKVVVALFFNPHGADDNAALRAVRGANRHGGRVIVHSIPIADVGDYDAITTGVQVLEAPTVIVIGPDNKARTIVGYTDVKEIDQTVGDVGGKAFEAAAAKHRSAFARKVSFVCDGTSFGIDTAGAPRSVGELVPFVNKGIRLERHDRAKVGALHPKGAKEVAAKRALLRAYDEDMAAAAQFRTQIKSGAAVAPALVALLNAEKRLHAENSPALHAIGDHKCLG